MRNHKLFIEGFFDAEGCVKVIERTTRITPKICLDFTNTRRDLLDLVKDILWKIFRIEARYSVQAYEAASGMKIAYHLRIYRKEFVSKFLDEIHTTKLTPEKSVYVKKWLKRAG